MWRWAIAHAVLAWADGAVSSVFSVLPGWKLSWESSQLSSDSKASTDIYVKNYLVVVLIQTWQTKHWGPLSSLFRKNLICPLHKCWVKNPEILYGGIFELIFFWILKCLEEVQTEKYQEDLCVIWTSVLQRWVYSYFQWNSSKKV